MSETCDFEPSRPCPDCAGKLHEIKLIDKSFQGIHTEMEYALGDAARSFWTSSFPVAGRVRAFLCDSCGRILLYGAEKE